MDTFETRWLKIKLIEKLKKTNVYDVISKTHKCVLGQIRWDTGWRHYLFLPTTDFKTKHSDRCLINIGTYIKELNKNHKNIKKN